VTLVFLAKSSKTVQQTYILLHRVRKASGVFVTQLLVFVIGNVILSFLGMVLGLCLLAA